MYLKIGPNWPNRQYCLAGSSKTAPRIFFSIVLGAEYSFYVESIANYAPQKVDYNNSFLGSMIVLWVPTFFMHNKLILDRVLCNGIIILPLIDIEFPNRSAIKGD